MPESANCQSAVACPFCGLLCDDLEIDTDASGALIRVANACERGETRIRAAYTRPPQNARVDGQDVDQETAIAAAAERLASARAPQIGGLATDVRGARAAIALAELACTGIDHMHGRAMLRNQRVLQRTGWFTTTLTEIRNRADLVVVVDDRILDDYPRLGERVLRPDDSLLPDRIAKREVISINEQTTNHAVVDEAIEVGAGRLLDFLATLRHGLSNDDGEANNGPAARLLERLRTSEYSVFIWSAGRLSGADGDLVIDAIADIVRTLNVSQRSAGLPIAGTNGDVTANQVCTWQTGLPLRVSFADHTPRPDTVSLDSQTLISRGALDCLLWIEALAPTPAPPGDAVTIVIGTDAATHPDADVFLPVETPGVGNRGLMFRTDNVVAVPLRALRQAREPSVAMVIEQIADAYRARVGQAVRA